mmetsp:Transcript_7377/g.13099  ORF Transcript_7377/g.13099 Transcript_7377/m.13099 type:complete len:904 (-) Transcript_7377:200-2911(-)
MPATLRALPWCLLLLCVQTASASWWHFKARPWGDAHKRHAFRKGMLKDAYRRAVDYNASRRAMDVTDPDTGEFYLPRPDGLAMVNGELKDYAAFNCPWADRLDPEYPAMCLPYQNSLDPLPDIGQAVLGVEFDPDAPTRSEGFTTPGGVEIMCGGWIEDALKRWIGIGNCAMQSPGGNPGPICETWIEDCKFSKPKTRECKSDKCKEWQSRTRCTGTDCPLDYPQEIRVPYPQEYPGNDADEPDKCTKKDSELQWLMCGIPCPEKFPMDAPGDFSVLGGLVLAFIIISALLGGLTIFMVKGEVKNFFVAGRSLPLYVVFATLGSQLFDSSSALGNLDLGYAYHWWDGAVFPLGLGLSLVLNGIFFARPLNEMNLLTLPDLFGRKYGPLTEVLCSVITIISFNFLLAGNLVGCGKIVSFLFDIPDILGILLSTLLIWAYASAGGLFSVAYTDVAQAAISWSGFFICTIWIQNQMPNHPGTSAAYPVGDKGLHWSGMTDADAYDPIPNAIVLNWATVIVLALGNLMALDFQARCFAAKTPTTAQAGCLLAGFLCGALGVFNTFNCGTVRALYGPSSPHAEYVANSCSADITIVGCFGADGNCNAVPVPGVPTCGEWKPDPFAALKMLTCSKEDCHYFIDIDGSAGYSAGEEGNYPINGFIGGWMLLGIVAASMSTADGAIVAMGTVFAHNFLRKFGGWFEEEKNLLNMSRLSTLMWAAISASVAVTRPNETGYFLLVAFDCVLAGGVVPLFAAVYWPNIKPIAGLAALLSGTIIRAVLEFALPKDGLLLLAGSYARNFGPNVAADPEMFDIFLNGGISEVCPQEDLEDWTGIDSLVAPVISLVFLVVFQLLPFDPKHKLLTPVPAPPPPEEEAAPPAASQENAAGVAEGSEPKPDQNSPERQAAA